MQKILKYLPLFSALLILIGYLNYYSFYKCFDIEISSYLTTGELLLSFLPLTVPILIILLFFFFMLTGVLVALPFKKDKEIDDSGDDIVSLTLFFHSLKRLSDDLKNDKLSKFYKVGFFPVHVISLIIGLFFIAFFGFYLFTIVEYTILGNSEFKIPALILILSSLLWIPLIFDIINRIYNNPNKDTLQNLKFGFVLFIFITLVVITNKESAFNIKHGRPKYNITMELADSTINSDTTFVFLGKTKDYLFLRDLKENKNVMYSTTYIKRLELKKN